MPNSHAKKFSDFLIKKNRLNYKWLFLKVNKSRRPFVRLSIRGLLFGKYICTVIIGWYISVIQNSRMSWFFFSFRVSCVSDIVIFYKVNLIFIIIIKWNCCVVGHLRKLFGLLETELAYESSLLFMMWKTAFILVFYW